MGGEEPEIHPGCSCRRYYHTVGSRYDRPLHLVTLLADLSALGGWDARRSEYELEKDFIKKDLVAEIDEAFANVDYALKHAGGKGWSQVYRVVTYSTDIPSQSEHIVANFRKWMPNHCPVWTQLGVSHLGSKQMHFEIDVEAYDEEGAAEARKAKK